MILIIISLVLFVFSAWTGHEISKNPLNRSTAIKKGLAVFAVISLVSSFPYALVNNFNTGAVYMFALLTAGYVSGAVVGLNNLKKMGWNAENIQKLELLETQHKAAKIKYGYLEKGISGDEIGKRRQNVETTREAVQDFIIKIESSSQAKKLHILQ